MGAPGPIAEQHEAFVLGKVEDFEQRAGGEHFGGTGVGFDQQAAIDTARALLVDRHRDAVPPAGPGTQDGVLVVTGHPPAVGAVRSDDPHLGAHASPGGHRAGQPGAVR